MSNAVKRLATRRRACGYHGRPMSDPQQTRAKIPIRVPSRLALPLLGVIVACIAYAWPLLLTSPIRRNLKGGALYAVRGARAEAPPGELARAA